MCVFVRGGQRGGDRVGVGCVLASVSRAGLLPSPSAAHTTSQRTAPAGRWLCAAFLPAVRRYHPPPVPPGAPANRCPHRSPAPRTAPLHRATPPPPSHTPPPHFVSRPFAPRVCGVQGLPRWAQALHTQRVPNSGGIACRLMKVAFTISCKHMKCQIRLIPSGTPLPSLTPKPHSTPTPTIPALASHGYSNTQRAPARATLPSPCTRCLP